MRLEPEQEDLLTKFVEAHRKVRPEERGGFLTVQTYGDTQAEFLHTNVEGVSVVGSIADADVLADHGLLRRSNSQGIPMYSVMPLGVQHYSKGRNSAPAIDTVEDTIRRFLTATEFRSHHSRAYSKWEQASKALWSAESKEQLTTVGHLCREAMQEFASSLAAQNRVDVAHIEVAKTINRLHTIVEARQSQLGDTESAFLETLVAYWRAVSELVQRQEHGGQREKEALTWEDGRRVVFQTCVVMFELSRALTRPS